MRDHGRYTPLQGRILREELTERIGEGLSEVEPGPIKRPTPPLDDTYREDQPIVEDPTYKDPSEYDREDAEWMRRPLGDT